MISEDSIFEIECIDGAKGLSSLPDKSVKLIYGSPPYPNADRNYGNWASNEYIDKISPFIDEAKKKLRDDGFLVINIKANRERATTSLNSRRSLVVEKLAILLEERWGFYCVDIEIWIKDNPVPTGLRVACQDAYEQNLWFSVSPKWKINLDAIRRPYDAESLKAYANNEYRPRHNGLSYVRKAKYIVPNPKGALPLNVIKGAVSGKQGEHQAMQPGYIPKKYILATTSKGDLVVDPWVGSGTTGYEAIKLGRKFIGFDISQEYVALSNRLITELIDIMSTKAKVSKQREIIQRKFVEALGTAVISHSDFDERPLAVDITEPIRTKLIVYIFPATHPPGGRSADEYKFNLAVPNQERGQKGNFDNSEGIVILASYEEELDVFVLYDPEKHKDFAYNANVQCKSALLYDALDNKVAFATKNNGEVLMAARPEYLLQALRHRLFD